MVWRWWRGGIRGHRGGWIGGNRRLIGGRGFIGSIPLWYCSAQSSQAEKKADSLKEKCRLLFFKMSSFLNTNQQNNNMVTTNI
jgi:hypothetical protein